MKPFLLLVGWLLAVALTSHVSAQVQATLNSEQLDFFETRIRPVLAANCYECHSANGKGNKGGLLLDTREGLLKGGESGPALVPGDLQSRLLVRIRHDDGDPDLAMPPEKDRLADAIIADFEQWVKMGAPDPRVASAKVKGGAWSATAVAEHWAFKKVVNPPIPQAGKFPDFVRNPIDNFIVAKLSEKQLQPSPAADRYTLIRRVTYDLTGLPPTPEEVDAFLVDPTPDAYEKVVDRLLASPRYGERWGRHWLDIARYADTNGDRGGGARCSVYPYAWTYRDYVIQAFNDDLPYDRFIIEQLAADRLPESRDDPSRLPALGFLTVGKRFMGNENDVLDDRIDVVTRGLMGLTGSCARCHDHKFDPIPIEDYYSLYGIFSSCSEPRDGALLSDPERNPAYADYLAEVDKIEQEVTRHEQAEQARLVSAMLENAGEYLLASHDWFRLTAKEKKGYSTGYYSIRARLKRSLLLELAYPWYVQLDKLKAEGSRDPVFRPWFQFAALSEDQFREQAPALLKEIRNSAEVHPAIVQTFSTQTPASLAEVAAIYAAVFAELHRQLELEKFHPNDKLSYEDSKTRQVLTDPDLESLRRYLFGADSPLRTDLAVLVRSQYLFPRITNAIRTKVVSLNLTHPGAPVRAMTVVDKPAPKDAPVFIRGEPENLGPVVPRQFLSILSGENRPKFTEGSGRLELARAIVSRDNPLTVRVMVNRVWQWHFGQAIVRTVSDFGTRSEPPTHPELLDWLAVWLMDHDWSLKQLHKLIVTSGTYRQQSLATDAAGEADPTNQWLSRFNLRRLDFEEVRDTLLFISQTLDPKRGGPPFILGELGPNMAKPKYVGADFSAVKNNSPRRRTVYALVDRSGLPEVFNTFDFADPDMSTGERVLTTVPQQSLFLMNSPFIAEQIEGLLSRNDFPSGAGDDEKVTFLFRTIFQRLPQVRELELARQFLKSASVDATTSTDAIPQRRLNAWERYTQVLLLTNELLFLN